MAEDGEEVESTLMYDNTFDYNPEWMSNLQDVEESRKYTMKCLEKMGLHGSQGKIILMASSPTKTLLTIPQVQHHLYIMLKRILRSFVNHSLSIAQELKKRKK